MNIDQLVYFLHVAETGSINATAQKFYMTQQAISASIKKMETELDTTLIRRTHKGVSLTPQGYLFASHAKDLVQRYDSAVYELQKYNAAELQLHGRISVFSASIFTNLFLPEVIRSFRQIYPDTQIQIIDVDVQDLLPYLFGHYCDVALFSVSQSYLEQKLAEHPDIQSATLAQDQIVLCMRPDHPLYRDRTATLKALKNAEQPHLTNSREMKYKYSLYQILTENAFLPNVFSSSVSNSSNVALHKKLIAEGLAITYMPYMAYQYEFKNDGYVCLPIQDSYPIEHCLLYHEEQNAEKAKLIQIFSAFVQKQFRQKFGAYQ